MGLLGAVLVQGWEAHHLHRCRSLERAGTAELRLVLDGTRYRKNHSHHLCTGTGRTSCLQPRLQEDHVDIEPRWKVANPALYRGLHAAEGVNRVPLILFLVYN